MKMANPRRKPGQNFLIASLVFAIALIFLAWSGVNYAINTSMKSQATDLAVRWRNFVQHEFHDFELIFAKGEFTLGDRFLFDSANALLGVIRYKIITPSGNIVVSSIPNEVGLMYLEAEDHGGHTDFETIVEKARIEIQVDIKSDEKDNERTVGEAYVPIIRKGDFLGIAELYIDFTEQHNRAAGTILAVFLATSVLATALVGLIVILLRYYARFLDKADSALRQSGEKYRNLFEYANDSIFISDPSTSLFLDVNENAARRLGYTKEELLQKLVPQIGKPELGYRTAGIIEEIQEIGHIVFEHVHVRKDATEMPVEISSRLIDLGGRKVIQSFVRDISERKRTEDALRESEEKFRNLVEGSIQGINIQREGKSLFVNKTFANIFGYNTPEEWLGLESYAQVVPEQELTKMKGYREARLRGQNAPTHYEGQAFKKDGTPIWVETRISVVNWDGKPAVQATIIDITERKGAEEALRKSERRIRKFIDSAPVLLGYIDKNLRYQQLNAFCLEHFGMKEEEAIGKSVLEVVGPEVFEMLRPFIEKVLGGEVVLPFVFRRSIGSSGLYDLSTSYAPNIDENGEVLGFYFCTLDITEHKKLEAQLLQSQKTEAIGTLAGGIAHDFNNILQPILMFANLLRFEVPADSEGTKYLEQIGRSAARAKDLVSKILLFSRQGETAKTPTNLGAVAEEVVGLMYSTLPKSITLELASSDDLPLVLCDPSQIHQVLLNLCINGSHAIAGQGKLMLKLSDVELEGLPSVSGKALVGRHVRIAVTDTGTGMDEETRQRIFDPFFTTKEVGEGTGLGLSSALGIVQSFGGGIVVSTELGRGSTFEVFLPVFEGEQENVRDTQPAPVGTETILFVDDEEAIVQGWKIQLGNLGYDVTAISDSGEALEVFNENPDRFALVITDQSMPGMNGDTLIREMRKLNSKVPVILCTGLAEGLSPETVSAIGINAVLGKPLDSQELGQAIREVLDEPKQA